MNTKYNVFLRNSSSFLSPPQIWCFPSRVKPYQRRQYFLNGFWQNLLLCQNFAWKPSTFWRVVIIILISPNMFKRFPFFYIKSWWPCHLAAKSQIGGNIEMLLMGDKKTPPSLNWSHLLCFIQLNFDFNNTIHILERKKQTPKLFKLQTSEKRPL